MSVPTAGAILAGKYVLHRRLGAGGFGAVYEGENVDLGKRVAIKLIAGRHSESEEAVARFRREARASAKIESANIVQVFDVGEDETYGLYMVMELLRGEDLRRKLDRAGKLGVEFAVDITHQILCGLAKAHAMGVIHRDLKPANVFLHQPNAQQTRADEDDDDQRVTVKVVDFGVAKLLDEALLGAVVQPLTTAGKTLGTPQYMSPEQVQGLPFDHRGDLWSVGALLHEMLSGRPAFALRDTFQQTALAIVHERPERLTSVPRELVEVIDRALAKEPDARFADATSFADALMRAVPEAFIDERVAARVAELVAVHPHRLPSLPPAALSRDEELPLERRRLGVIIAITVLAAAAFILVLAALRKRVPAERIAAFDDAAPAHATPSPRPTPLPEPIDSGTMAEPIADSGSVDSEPDARIGTPASSTTHAPPKAPEQFGGTGVSSQF